MSPTCLDPEPEIIIEEEPARFDEPAPAGWKQRVRDLLVAIFQGHEEYLGLTPD